jgi:hypothetical protein
MRFSGAPRVSFARRPESIFERHDDLILLHLLDPDPAGAGVFDLQHSKAIGFS